MSGHPTVHTLESLRAKCIEEGDCLLWQGRMKSGGNNTRRLSPAVGRKAVPVRRLMVELTRGKPIAAGLVTSPTCGNERCVNPDHVAVHTVAKARALAASFGAYINAPRTMRAALTRRARSHITEEVVAQIRAAKNCMEAHRLTGVDPSYAAEIRRGSARRDLVANPFAGLMR
jgi:hypothetical protein